MPHPLMWDSGSCHRLSWLLTRLKELTHRPHAMVCLRYLRDRCSGLVTMITAMATAHHSATSSHPCLTESAPENMAVKKPPVLIIACMSMAISTLPPVLLNSHVNMTVQATTNNGSESRIN